MSGFEPRKTRADDGNIAVPELDSAAENIFKRENIFGGAVAGKARLYRSASRCGYDSAGRELFYGLNGSGGVELYFNALLAANFHEVVYHPCGLGLFGRGGGEIDLTAGHHILFKYRDGEAALSENICGGESCGARAYDDGCAPVSVILEQVALVADKRVDGAFAVSADKRICLHRFKAVEAANENAKLNGLTHCEFIAGDVAKTVNSLKERPDIIIVDPPRPGIHKDAVRDISKFNAEEIIYISCNPKTLVVDLQGFEGYGYEVKKVRCMDMFPNTPHCETVVLLQRKDK